MLSEIDAALASLSLQPSAIICPVGVGSLAHAVISHYKTYHHPSRPAIIAVESRNAPCLITSLCNGELTTVPTTPTIMAGLCCGTPSSAAWEAMKGGVDLTVTVSEKEAHRAVLEMKRQGVDAGPCGAAGLAAFWKIGGMGFQSIRVGKDGVVVVLCTEGSREYPVPNQGDGRIRLAVSETVV
jgi:diaminopropionate ammonia-lyase